MNGDDGACFFFVSLEKREIFNFCDLFARFFVLFCWNILNSFVCFANGT